MRVWRKKKGVASPALSLSHAHMSQGGCSMMGPGRLCWGVGEKEEQRGSVKSVGEREGAPLIGGNEQGRRTP